LRDGRIPADIEFIRSNPVCGDGLLGGFQVELPTANQLVKLSFEPIFHLGVPKKRWRNVPAAVPIQSKISGRSRTGSRLGVSGLNFFGIIRNIAHTASEGKTMKNGLLTIRTILALTCIGQAKDKPASAQNSQA
jgi:hypothetical protein